MTPVRY